VLRSMLAIFSHQGISGGSPGEPREIHTPSTLTPRRSESCFGLVAVSRGKPVPAIGPKPSTAEARLVHAPCKANREPAHTTRSAGFAVRLENQKDDGSLARNSPRFEIAPRCSRAAHAERPSARNVDCAANAQPRVALSALNVPGDASVARDALCAAARSEWLSHLANFLATAPLPSRKGQLLDNCIAAASQSRALRSTVSRPVFATHYHWRAHQ
jgi:hypothetical protein